MSQGSRPARIGEQIRVEIAEALMREVKDPGVGFLTITRVKVSADLSTARVYFTAFGGDRARTEAERALGRAASFLRRHIGQRLRLRRAPMLEFQFDESVEGQERVERLFEEIHKTDAERAASLEHGDDDPEQS